MVSIVSCLSGTALKGRIARKTFVGILQLIVLVSLTTKQTNAKKAKACYGWQFDPPPRCDGGLTVNVLSVTIGSKRPCEGGDCCSGRSRCEVSAAEVEQAFYESVMATCHGRQVCDGLQAPSSSTSLVDCDDSRRSDDEESDQVSANSVKITYNCTREAPYDVTTDSGEASRRGSASDQVGVAVGVTVAVLVVVGVITAVLVIYFLRRRKKQMERQTGKDEMASHATPVPNSYDNAFYQEVIPSAPPPTPGGTTRDPPPLDPTASSGHPHPPSPGAAQDTDYDLVRSPYAKVQRPTSQDSEYDLRLMENPTYN